MCEYTLNHFSEVYNACNDGGEKTQRGGGEGSPQSLTRHSMFWCAQLHPRG